MKRHAAPILAAILLLLPVLYVGSYLALVVPEGTVTKPTSDNPWIQPTSYRVGDQWSEAIFWPLEQIDRKVRPGRWGWQSYPAISES